MNSTRKIKTMILPLAISLMFGTVSLGANTVGKAAPDFTLKTHDGKSLTLSKLKGKRGAVLVFFATWCPACMAEVPQVKKFVRASRDKGVLVYGVNIRQTGRVVQRFVKERGINYRILLDKNAAVAYAYGVSGIPLVVGIDARGIIRYRAHSMPKDAAGFITLLTSTLKMREDDRNKADKKVKVIDRNTLMNWIKTGDDLVIIDVLPPENYHRQHIKGAINIPLGRLDHFTGMLPKNGRIVTYCASFACHASSEAARKLGKLGFDNVYDYAGGIKDWSKAGLPVIRGRDVKFVDIDRLRKWIKSDSKLVIIDVLSPESFAKAHIPGAVNIPLNELGKRAGEITRDARIVVYCANYICRASTAAAEKLGELGFKQVYDYKGGIQEWLQQR